MPPAARSDQERIDSYLVCATPRTGSTLLCGLLDSTGVAGHPESYFRQQGEHEWAARWGIVSPSDGTFDYADYLQAAIGAGSTANGVFAARIMWETLDGVVAKLAPLYPDLAGSDVDLLNEAFGRTRYVYLRRGDVVAQAVSLLRAEQTNMWHKTARGPQEPQAEPHFDLDLIHERVCMIEEHNTAWREWFATAGIQPYLVRYEDLDAASVPVARGVAGFLGLDLPAGREIVVRHERQADALNAQWIDRYRLQGRSGESGPELRTAGTYPRVQAGGRLAAGSGARVEDEGVIDSLSGVPVLGPKKAGSSDSVYWPVLAR